MLLTKTQVTPGLETSIVVSGVRHEIRCLSEDRFIVFFAGEHEGCSFKVQSFVNETQLMLHEHDVHVATGEVVPRREYCKIKGSQYSVSPHDKAARAFAQAIASKLVPRDLASGKPIRRPGGRNRCPNCGTPNPGDPCVNCEYSPSQPE